MIFEGKKFARKVAQNFSANLRKFGQKSFAPQNVACFYNGVVDSQLVSSKYSYYYSGFTFSHYDLPFPTRYYIPFMRSGLYQLVIRVKRFRVSAHDLDTHCMIRFCPSAWTPRFQKESSCVSLAHGPRWLFLLSRHRKAFLLLLIRSLL